MMPFELVSGILCETAGGVGGLGPRMPVLASVTRIAGSGAGAADGDGAVVDVSLGVPAKSGNDELAADGRSQIQCQQ